MNKILFKPFELIAGFKALILGLLVITITSLIAPYSNTHFPDLLSVKIFPDVKFTVVLLENIINWISTSLVFYLTGLAIAQTKVRAIDIFGTMALSRAPYLISVLFGFSKSMINFGYYIQYTLLGIGEPIELSRFQIFTAILLSILTIIFTIWMVALMVNAFKVSANLKGPRLVWGFIIAIIISILITLYANNLLLTQIL